jgi:hypothetical protein
MNQSLGGGNEANGRPFLGGIGASQDGASARQGSGLPFVGPLEAFARVASSIASGAGSFFSDQISDATGGSGSGSGREER